MSVSLLRGFFLGCSRSTAHNLLGTIRPNGALLPNLFKARKPLSLSLNFTSNRLQVLHSQAQPPTTGSSPILQFTKNTPWQATHRHLGRDTRHSRYGHGGGRRGGWLDSIPPNAIFWGVITINGAVFLAWQFAKSNYQVNRDPALWKWMSNNFHTSLRNLKEGRIWTIVTSCFSQSDIGHLFMNGFTFFFMARPVLEILGNARFLTLYLGAGIVSSAVSILWSTYYYRNPNHASHGASGAIYGIVSFFACTYPTATFAIFGLIPCPAWLFVSGIFLYDTYSSFKQTGWRGTTDTAGHVGGLMAGISYFIAKRLRIM